MARRVFQILTGLSLLLLIATVVLWVRSYGGSDYIQWSRGIGAQQLAIESRGDGLETAHGQLRFVTERNVAFVPDLKPGTTQSLDFYRTHWAYGRLGVGHVFWDSPRRSIWNHLGFGIWETGMMTSFSDTQRNVFAVPMWLLVIFLALLPGLRMALIRRMRRRHAAGLCPMCGYDLRATPDHCPECGARFL